MKTVHFIYPYGPKISAPQSIGREVALRLRERYEVIQYQWDEQRTIEPSPNAILIGHAHPYPWTIFRQSAKIKGWNRIILLEPFQHGDISQVAFIDHVVSTVNLFLSITGNAWFETLQQSPVAHWLPKMRHVDLAVNRSDFPQLKNTFNPPEQRKFLYIGNSQKFKNLPWLNEIAKALPQYKFSWVGAKEQEFEGLDHLGYHDFSTPSGQEIIAQHDFMITVGEADANPTTILEAMAWGLIPVCTEQSGYRGYPGIINVPLNDTTATLPILRNLQQLPTQELSLLQYINTQALDQHFNWDRFSQQVIDAIESDESPTLGKAGLHTMAQLRLAEANSYLKHRSMRLNTVRMLSHGLFGQNHPMVRWAKRLVTGQQRT